MRTSRGFLLYSTFLVLFSTIASAWPWPKFLPDLDSIIVRRAGKKNVRSAYPPKLTLLLLGSSSAAATETTVSESPKATTGSGSMKITAAPSTTGSVKATGSGSKSDSITGTRKTTATGAKHTIYDPRLAPGGLSMTLPANALGVQLYKIGDWVSFGWNYTSLSVTPTALDILATNNANSVTFTLAQNQTFDATPRFYWDTSNQSPETPYPQATYGLVIYDSDSSPSAAASAGYLAVYNSFKFIMYQKQDYHDETGINCVTCSGAMSDMDRKAVRFAVGMGIITVLSFTWFVGGTGVVW
jgi:hypothetical protein